MEWNLMLGFVTNIGVALLLGTLIGLERQFGQHPAGLRTNALVCLGSAMFVSLGILIDKESSPTRIAGQVASGIGFLGGGVIMREGLNVRGMNTAATLWCTAAVGILSGLGFPMFAAVGTAAVLGVHVVLKHVSHAIDRRAKKMVKIESTYSFRVHCQSDHAALVRSILMRHVHSQPNMSIQGLSTVEADSPGKSLVTAEIYSQERNEKILNELVSRLSIETSVEAVNWDRG